MKKVFAIWAREVKLNEFLGKALGAEIITSYRKRWYGQDLPAFLRYIVQGIDTYRRLKKAQPEIVFVMNPPITAPLVVYLYCLFNKAKFIIDTHTAGFLDKKWVYFHWLHRFLARRAILNTVHNYKNLEFLTRWGIGNGYVLQFYNPSKSEIYNERVKLSKNLSDTLRTHSGLKIFMVNRFAGDDAWQEVMETAKIMPKELFFLTGDYSKIKTIAMPRNVYLTGYLKHAEFIKLMEECDVVLALTKRPDTVLWSIREIMALGKPFVTTDSEVLKHYFSEVAFFSSHNPRELSEKIKEAYEKRFEIKVNIEKFLEKDRERWKKDIKYVFQIIENNKNQIGN